MSICKSSSLSATANSSSQNARIWAVETTFNRHGVAADHASQNPQKLFVVVVAELQPPHERPCAFRCGAQQIQDALGRPGNNYDGIVREPLQDAQQLRTEFALCAVGIGDVKELERP